LKALWVTDRWETLDHRRDTTLRLVQESLARGHEASWCDPAGIRFESGRVLARRRRVLGAPADRDAAGWRLAAAADIDVASLDQIHYRTDPPVDRTYWEPLQLLAMAIGGRGPELVNPLRVLTGRGDKLGPPALARALPPTIASSSWECLAAFARAEGRTVLKPLGDAQSRGVHLLDWTTDAGAERARVEIDRLSAGLSRPVVLQRFLHAIAEGEKRLWFADGELLAYVRKRPQEGTFVVDVDKGSACEACALDPAERRLAAAIGDGFCSEGIRLAAVDVIGGHVTDWNLTSPGMIPMMERILGRDLAGPIVDALARGRR
jgi:glutathione synthase